MERSEAERILAEAVSSRRAAQETVRQLHTTIDGTALVIEGVLKMFPDLLTGDELDWGDQMEPTTPRSGSDAVWAILSGEPLQWMTVRAVVQRLERNDWMPQSESPVNAVRTALARALSHDNWPAIEKNRNEKGQVVYRYNPKLLEA